MDSPLRLMAGVSARGRVSARVRVKVRGRVSARVRVRVRSMFLRHESRCRTRNPGASDSG